MFSVITAEIFTGQFIFTLFHCRKNRLVGAPIWLAPEIIRRNSFTTGVDIWSIGATFIEMAEAQPRMFSVPSMRARGLIGTRVTPHFANPREHSKVLRHLLEHMQVRNTFERETAKSLLLHKFLHRAEASLFWWCWFSSMRGLEKGVHVTGELATSRQY